MQSPTIFNNSLHQHLIAHQITASYGPDTAQILSFRSDNMTRIQIMLFFCPGMFLQYYRHPKLTIHCQQAITLHCQILVMFNGSLTQ
eukprot:10739821-Ditylum_brightwellii.AAC.1